MLPKTDRGGDRMKKSRRERAFDHLLDFTKFRNFDRASSGALVPNVRLTVPADDGRILRIRRARVRTDAMGVPDLNLGYLRTWR